MSRTVAERKHLARVSSFGCALCRRLGYEDTPAAIHHPREGQGAAQRADDWLSFGLCPTHHDSPRGFHGMGKAVFESRYQCTELDLLADTLALCYGSTKPALADLRVPVLADLVRHLATALHVAKPGDPLVAIAVDTLRDQQLGAPLLSIPAKEPN